MPWITSHGLNWENKTYEEKRSILLNSNICWKNGLRDCHAVKVNFIPLVA